MTENRFEISRLFAIPLKGQFRGFRVEVGGNEDLRRLLFSSPLLLLLLLLPPLANWPLLMNKNISSHYPTVFHAPKIQNKNIQKIISGGAIRNLTLRPCLCSPRPCTTSLPDLGTESSGSRHFFLCCFSCGITEKLRCAMLPSKPAKKRPSRKPASVSSSPARGTPRPVLPCTPGTRCWRTWSRPPACKTSSSSPAVRT